MAAVLRSIGYRTRLHVVPDALKYFQTILDSGTRAQIGFGWASDFPSESGFIQPLFSCAAFVPGNRDATTDPSGFCSRSIDRQIAHAVSVQAQDPRAAHALWRQIEREILAQAPMVPTYNHKNVDLLAKRVGNYQFHPQWGPLIDQLWVR
jgi:peptide/nickel transport system substrate-binding protein